MAFTMDFPPAEQRKMIAALVSFNRKLIEPLEQGVREAGKVVETTMKQAAPYPSIASRIRMDKKITSNSNEIFVRVRSGNPSSHLFEFGTGVFHRGHEGRETAVKGMIVPKTEEFMIFKPRGLDHFIKKRTVKGMQAKPFIAKSALETGAAQLAAYQKAYRANESKLSMKS